MNCLGIGLIGLDARKQQSNHLSLRCKSIKISVCASIAKIWWLQMRLCHMFSKCLESIMKIRRKVYCDCLLSRRSLFRGSLRLLFDFINFQNANRKLCTIFAFSIWQASCCFCFIALLQQQDDKNHNENSLLQFRQHNTTQHNRTRALRAEEASRRAGYASSREHAKRVLFLLHLVTLAPTELLLIHSSVDR